ncbi:unnamed protein product [Rotaria sordida]|uniref:Transposase n=1 Tax=Rotaria sordida TaxID=392033 RepID=A0A819DF97_9BILA|nr:unnamed protein product [Rotaria sordida]
MAGTHDTEQQRIIVRIKCIAFREARDAVATFINRQWIADKIHRTTRFVIEWWEKSYDDCFADYSECGRKLKLSDANKGESWTGQYFRDTILMQHIFPFLKDEENVIDADDVTFFHDKAPCMQANMTQHLFQDNNINLWETTPGLEIHLI